METAKSLVKDGILQYDVLLTMYPWLTAREQNAILSPDVDGILCGLLMSHYFNWNIVGFYSGKSLVVKQEVNPKDCIFLDMDIFRKDIRSRPNTIKKVYVPRELKKKYPFGTIHFLLCILGSAGIINCDLPEEAISILFFTSGTVKNLFNYPENCESWFRFLNVKNSRSPVYPMFIKFADMKLDVLIPELASLSRIFKQTVSDGDIIRIQKIKKFIFLKKNLLPIEELVCLLAKKTGWTYVPERWAWAGLNASDFNFELQ